MAHSNTVLSQMLKKISRHEFEKLANTVDGKVRSTAMSRWSQFVALTVGQLSGRQSLRDIESCLSSQRHIHYHLGTQTISKSALGRANEQRDADFYTQLFQLLYQRCTSHTPWHGFRFKHELFFTGWLFVECIYEAFSLGGLQSQKGRVKVTCWAGSKWLNTLFRTDYRRSCF